MYSELINYAIRFTACTAFFYVFYVVMLKNETCFRFNRGYLISTLLLSLALPLLRFDFVPGSNALLMTEALILPEVIVSEDALAAANSQFQLITILNVLYGLVATSLLILFTFRLVALYRIISTNKHLRTNKFTYKVIPTNGQLPTSSFLNYLLWDDTHEITENQKAQIVAHERVHIEHHHTYDILLLEGFSIIFWFNPLIWLWKKVIKENHEYIADAEASKGEQLYSSLLAKHALEVHGFAMTHAFKSSDVFKRLQMLNRYGQRTKWVKFMAVIPLMVFMIFTMSFSLQDLSEDRDVITSPHAVFNNSHNSEVSAAKKNEQEPPIEVLESKLIDSKNMNLKKAESKTTERLVDTDMITTNRKPNRLKKDAVFTIVEQSATPQNGIEGFYRYVSKNLKYPKQARKLGISGRVFIEFIVDKEGNLTNIHTLKGIGAGCDAEAVRVIKNSEPWTPAQQRGKRVQQKIVLPITFKLG